MVTVTNEPPPPKCSVCRDTGWKTIETPEKVSRVDRCDCWFDTRVQRLLKLAGIPARYEHCRLSDFDANFQGAHRSLAQARLIAGRFVEEYPQEKVGLLLTGKIGVGKTHLAVGILQELIRIKKIACLFCDYRELLKEIQNSYNPTVQTTELEILRPVFDAEVLVLDELGAVKPSEWVWDTVSYVLNYRYNNNKTTIITTNFPNLPPHNAPDEDDAEDEEKQQSVTSAEQKPESGTTKRRKRQITLGDRITERMRSRLLEMCRVVTMNGSDFRVHVRGARN